VKAITLINLCAREANDVGFERIAKDATTVAFANQPDWLEWLNDAQRAVVIVRPDANSAVANLTLALGSRQALPAAGIRLLGVTRNMGADGNTIGKAIRFTQELDLQGALNPDWFTTAPASPVREVFYDEKRDPLGYYVNPPALAGWKIEANVANTPTDVDNTTAVGVKVITLPDIYSGPMQSWMLYRYYALATQALNQLQRAQWHFKAFFNLLGVKVQADMFTGPRAPEGYPSVQPQQAGAISGGR
jgi:hypothetical protein